MSDHGMTGDPNKIEELQADQMDKNLMVQLEEVKNYQDADKVLKYKKENNLTTQEAIKALKIKGLIK